MHLYEMIAGRNLSTQNIAQGRGKTKKGRRIEGEEVPATQKCFSSLKSGSEEIRAWDRGKIENRPYRWATETSGMEGTSDLMKEEEFSQRAVKWKPISKR